jgi:hypothetical protein
MAKAEPLSSEVFAARTRTADPDKASAQYKKTESRAAGEGVSEHAREKAVFAVPEPPRRPVALQALQALEAAAPASRTGGGPDLDVRPDRSAGAGRGAGGASPAASAPAKPDDGEGILSYAEQGLQGIGQIFTSRADTVTPAVSAVPAGGMAVYEIATHTVFLPSGEALEAHSGLGPYFDDPDHVDLGMRGSTPPAIYELALRRELFHGVQALRLNPVKGNVFKRTGLLAHTFMLGDRGESNGCVSFRNYRAFLNAFLKGEVRKLMVVARR